MNLRLPRAYLPRTQVYHCKVPRPYEREYFRLRLSKISGGKWQQADGEIANFSLSRRTRYGGLWVADYAIACILQFLAKAIIANPLRFHQHLLRRW